MKGNHVKKNKAAAHFIPKPLKGKTDRRQSTQSVSIFLVLNIYGYRCWRQDQPLEVVKQHILLLQFFHFYDQINHY